MIPILLLAFLGVSLFSSNAGLYLAILATPLYLIRFPIFSIPTNLFEVFVLILALVVGVRLIVARTAPSFKFPKELTVGIVLLGVGLVIGCLVAPDKLMALGIVKSWFVVPMLLSLLVWHLVDKTKPNFIIPTLLLSTLPISLFALWQVGFHQFVTIDGRASAWFSSANYLSLYIVPILLASLGWLTTNKTAITYLGWCVWIIGLVALYFSFSFGGWAALGLGLLVYLGLVHRNYRWWGYGGIIALLAGIALYFTNHRFAQLFDLSQQTSGSVRLQVWATSLSMLKTHWLTGLGLGSFQNNYLSYASQLFHPPLETNILHPHSLYFQLVISTGLFGFIGFLWLVIQWWRKLSASAISIAQASLAAAMVAILAHGFIDNPVFKNDLAVIFWLIIALLYLPHVKTR